MNMVEVFNMMTASIPTEADNAYAGTATPPTQLGRPDDECIWDWEKGYNAARQSQVFQNSGLGGFISPYESHWTGPVTVMGNLEDLVQFEKPNKVDPNKIYNTDIAALKALQQDQQKIVKLFETRLRESLNERGKMGLTEEDILAMQAVTAGRTAIANIQKEQISIKKNISDTRIKQYQLEQNDVKISSKAQGGDGGFSGSTYDVGRSILDNIFDSALPVPAPSQMPQSTMSINPAADAAAAASVIDSIINLDTNTPSAIQYESQDPTTYVTVNSSGENASFETYAKDGGLIENYPNPSSKIVKIDVDAGTATDDLLVTYPLKIKDDQVSTDNINPEPNQETTNENK